MKTLILITLMALFTLPTFGSEKIELTEEMPTTATRETAVRININGSIADSGLFFFTESGEKHYIGEYAQPSASEFKGKKVNIRGRVKLSPSNKIFISVIGVIKEI